MALFEELWKSEHKNCSGKLLKCSLLLQTYPLTEFAFTLFSNFVAESGNESSKSAEKTLKRCLERHSNGIIIANKLKNVTFIRF